MFIVDVANTILTFKIGDLSNFIVHVLANKLTKNTVIFYQTEKDRGKWVEGVWEGGVTRVKIQVA